MNKLVQQLKENEQDFEWYSTTSEIIKVIQKDIKENFDDHYSILDIGAGDGNFFKILESLYTNLQIVAKNVLLLS